MTNPSYKLVPVEPTEAVINQAVRCDLWPSWMNAVVDTVMAASDKNDLSTEQCIGLGLLLAAAPPASGETEPVEWPIPVWIVAADTHDNDPGEQWIAGVFETEAEATEAFHKVDLWRPDGTQRSGPLNVRIEQSFLRLAVSPSPVPAVREASNTIARFNSIVEAIEARCMATDGPVTPTLKEMTEQELTDIWACLQFIRTALQGQRPKPRRAQ